MKTAGLTGQRLEVRKDEKTNTLTTVQKDNVVVFRPCELKENSKPADSGLWHAANATDIKGHEQRKRVYSAEGKAPTLQTCGGGGHEPKVMVFRPASIVGRRLNERGVRDDYNKDVAITQCLQVKHKSDKTGCLTTVDKDNVLSIEPPGRYPDIYNRCDISYRKLTPIECERLQTFPDNWTDCVSNTQRYKALGNAWTVDVIAHIFKCMQQVE